MHVHLHKVCQQVSREAGMSANPRSTWHTSEHTTPNLHTVDDLKRASLRHANSEVSKAMDILLMSPKQ